MSNRSEGALNPVKPPRPTITTTSSNGSISELRQTELAQIFPPKIPPRENQKADINSNGVDKPSAKLAKPMVLINPHHQQRKKIVTHKTIERALLAQSNECTRYMFKSALFMALAGPLGLICPTMALGIYCQYTRFTKMRREAHKLQYYDEESRAHILNDTNTILNSMRRTLWFIVIHSIILFAVYPVIGYFLINYFLENPKSIPKIH